MGLFLETLQSSILTTVSPSFCIWLPLCRLHFGKFCGDRPDFYFSCAVLRHTSAVQFTTSVCRRLPPAFGRLCSVCLWWDSSFHFSVISTAQLELLCLLVGHARRTVVLMLAFQQFHFYQRIWKHALVMGLINIPFQFDSFCRNTGTWT
jgi:hypothetical protein